MLKYISLACIAVLVIVYETLGWTNVGDMPNSSHNLKRDITWGDLNFLHTTDTHGWLSGHFNQKIYNANWGDFVSFSIKMKQRAHESGADLLLIDTGDKHDGNGLTDATTPNGVKALPIFTKQDYDLITIGNHELYLWENSKLEYEQVYEHYKEKYVVTNVEINVNGTFVNLGEKYRYFETPINKYRILSFGMLFNFNRNNENTRVTPIENIITQDWFLEILDNHPEEQVDYLVIIGHIPITHSWNELNILHKFLRHRYKNTVIQYFGGHSHIRDFVIYDDNLTSLESGRFCETIGWLSIDSSKEGLSRFSRSYLDFNLESFKHHLKTEAIETKHGNEIKDLIIKTREELNLNEYIGHVSNNYFMDYVPLGHPKSLFKLLTDKVLTSLKFNGESERVIIINTGSIRYDLYKGNYTLDTKYIVSPFENNWVKVKVPKSVAIKVSHILNKSKYISLLPANQFSSLTRNKPNLLSNLDVVEPMAQKQQLLHIDSENKLSKGYVTYDDFGNDGDDTIHKPVINYPITNVVESIQFKDQEQRDVDLVFYDFLTSNILDALKYLTKKDYSSQVQHYSDMYLNELLSEFIKSNDV